MRARGKGRGADLLPGRGERLGGGGGHVHRAGDHPVQAAAGGVQLSGEVGEYLASLGGDVAGADEVAVRVEWHRARGEDQALTCLDDGGVRVARGREQAGHGREAGHRGSFGRCLRGAGSVGADQLTAGPGASTGFPRPGPARPPSVRGRPARHPHGAAGAVGYSTHPDHVRPPSVRGRRRGGRRRARRPRPPAARTGPPHPVRPYPRTNPPPHPSAEAESGATVHTGRRRSPTVTAPPAPPTPPKVPCRTRSPPWPTTPRSS